MTISLFGVYFDEESGLYYLRARYYDPNVRRFISEDPVEDGGNWYVYCYNNPIMFFDPTGKIAVSDGVYSSYVQLQLLDYTEKYYRAKFLGEGNAGLYAREASKLRTKDNKRSFFDVKARQIENNLILAHAKAKSLGFAEGTDEYGVILWAYTVALNEIDERAQERYNAQLMFFAFFSISNLNSNGANNFTTNNKVIKAKDDILNWLGKDAKVITNRNGDKIFISADGKRRVRFDINNTYPHNNVHGHIEEFVNGSWQKSGPIYPWDVPHN